MMKVCPIRPLASCTLVSDDSTGWYHRLAGVMLQTPSATYRPSCLKTVSQSIAVGVGVESGDERWGMGCVHSHRSC